MQNDILKFLKITFHFSLGLIKSVFCVLVFYPLFNIPSNTTLWKLVFKMDNFLLCYSRFLLCLILWSITICLLLTFGLFHVRSTPMENADLGKERLFLQLSLGADFILLLLFSGGSYRQLHYFSLQTLASLIFIKCALHVTVV